MATFRKINNSWFVQGPASEVKVGSVAVRKADGSTKTVTVTSVTQPDAKGLVLGTIANDRPQASSSRCAECGRPGATIRRYDSSGIPGLCCPRCARMSRYELSFA